MIYGGNEIRRKEKQRAVETNRIMNFKRVMGGKKRKNTVIHRYSNFFLFYIDAVKTRPTRIFEFRPTCPPSIDINGSRSFELTIKKLFRHSLNETLCAKPDAKF